MTKAEIISKIAIQTGIDRQDVSDSIEGFFSIVKSTMAEGENVYIRGFGSFVNKKKARKTGRNISKNTAIVIAEHYAPIFKPSKIFVSLIKDSYKKQ